MEEGLPPPLALSLLISDNHIVDARTGQHSIIGIITHVQSTRYPVIVPRLCLYAELTNARGTISLTWRVVDADEARPPVATAEMELTSPDPLVVHQFGLGIGGLVFPEPGEYRAQLMAGGEVLLERRLVLVHLTSSEPPGRW